MGEFGTALNTVTDPCGFCMFWLGVFDVLHVGMYGILISTKHTRYAIKVNNNEEGKLNKT